MAGELVQGYGSVAAIFAVIAKTAWDEYRSRRLDKAKSSAEVDLVERLSKQLELSEARGVAHQLRADEIAKERNLLYQTVGELKGEVAGMRAELRAARMEISQLRGVAYVPAEPT
ncbi:hypothetical protein RBI22_15150 [Alcaligenaceae bacterium C4P045]|nr:hypothetical protein [Alcaligenaceae bacterium C4P045]